MFKVNNKSTRTASSIPPENVLKGFSRGTEGVTQVFLLLTLNIFHTSFTPNVSVADFEQVNVSWATNRDVQKVLYSLSQGTDKLQKKDGWRVSAKLWFQTGSFLLDLLSHFHCFAETLDCYFIDKRKKFNVIWFWYFVMSHLFGKELTGSRNQTDWAIFSSVKFSEFFCEWHWKEEVSWKGSVL